MNFSKLSLVSASICLCRRAAPHRIARESRWYRPVPILKYVTGALCIVFAANTAHAGCEVIADASVYDQRKEQSILLMQYGAAIVRATDGKIRCQEDQGSTQQVCEISGKGEMLVEAGTKRVVVRLTGEGTHSVHVAKDGDATCQP